MGVAGKCSERLCGNFYDLSCHNPKHPKFTNWDLRNNSDNIAGILHPSAPLLHRPPLTHNDCYCTGKKVPPKLLTRPKTCLCSEKTPGLDEDWFAKSFATSDSTKRLLESRCSRSSTEGYWTEIRRDMEQYRKERQEEVIDDIAQFDASRKTKMTSSSTTPPRSTTTSSSTPPPFKSLQKLQEFRMSNYFDTHYSTTQVQITDAECQTCVHQFKLDNRLVPVPLKPDAFGRSCCSHCGKTMKEFGKDKFLEASNKCSKARKKSYLLGMEPKRVQFGDGYNRVVVQLDEGDLGKFEALREKIKRPEYTNSLALRHQKMSLRCR